jgi:hypothetical protein
MAAERPVHHIAEKGFSARRTDEREIEVTSVTQLGSSFFVTKFRDQVTSATVESPEPRAMRAVR